MNIFLYLEDFDDNSGVTFLADKVQDYNEENDKDYPPMLTANRYLRWKVAIPQ